MQQENLEKDLWPPRVVLLGLCVKIQGFSVSPKSLWTPSE